MINTTWEFIEESGGSFPASGVAVLAPSNQIMPKIKSTRKVERLADGDLAIIKPETNFNKEPITFVWKAIKKDIGGIENLKRLIQGFIRDDIGVRIKINPEASSYDAEFYLDDEQSIDGFFLTADPEWKIGVEGNTQFYQFSAVFQPITVV